MVGLFAPGSPLVLHFGRTHNRRSAENCKNQERRFETEDPQLARLNEFLQTRALLRLGGLGRTGTARELFGEFPSPAEVEFAGAEGR